MISWSCNELFNKQLYLGMSSRVRGFQASRSLWLDKTITFNILHWIITWGYLTQLQTVILTQTFTTLVFNFISNERSNRVFWLNVYHGVLDDSLINISRYTCHIYYYSSPQRLECILATHVKEYSLLERNLETFYTSKKFRRYD